MNYEEFIKLILMTLGEEYEDEDVSSNSEEENENEKESLHFGQK